jgi:hypothetical protein
MSKITAELKNLKAVKKIQKVIAQVKAAQVQLQKLAKDKSAINETRRYAKQFRKELKKYLNADVARVRAFLDLARGELDSIQKQYLGGKGSLQRLVKKAKKLATKSHLPKKKAHAKRSAAAVVEEKQ